jgi:hypothetical protein
MKKCIICQQEKELEEFTYHNLSKDGRQSRCKACYKIYFKEWYDNSKIKKETKEKQTYSQSILNTDHLSFFHISQDDYREMYRVMEILGYDPKGDIHQQFNERHGLTKPRKRYDVNKNRWNYDDLF